MKDVRLVTLALAIWSAAITISYGASWWIVPWSFLTAYALRQVMTEAQR